MASAVDPSVIVDGANVAKSALRNQLAIVRDEISALQAAGPGAAGTIAVGNDAPVSPAVGRLWIDTNTPSTSVWTLSAWSGTVWVPLGRIDTATQRLTLIDGGIYVFATLTMQRQGGTKGGALLLQTPSSGTGLVGDNVVTEIDGSFWKVYESGTGTRGVQVDLSAGLVGGSSTLWHTNAHGVIEGLAADFTGNQDLNDAAWHTFGDVTLPDRASYVTVAGRVGSLHDAGASQTAARLRIRALNSSGTELATFDAGAWFAVPGRYEFFPLYARVTGLPDATGTRIQVQGKKDTAQGPLNVFQLFATYNGIRRR